MGEERIGYISIKRNNDGVMTSIDININDKSYPVELKGNTIDVDIREYIERVLKEDIKEKYKIIHTYNNKLKRSKMFIDKKAYAKICKQYGITLEDHLKRLDKLESPSMQDLDIMYKIYNSISKIIR